MWAFLMAVVVLPDDWDAWAQWGPKAKLLAVSAGPLSDVKYFVPGSGDYPVLWPAVWAFSGWLSGGWEEQWSKGWGAIFMALAAWQLSVIYWRAGGNRVGGLLFAALFVSSPAVPLVASWGYAEAPYWLMLVCAMSEVLMWQRDKQRKCLWYASFFVAAAASTKNEGIMFAVLCSMWVALCGRNVKDILAISIVPLVFAGVWRVYVAMVIGTSNHALGGFSQAGVDFFVMADMLRYALLYIVHHWLDPRQWNIVMPIALVASLWLAFKGGRRQCMCLLLPFAMLGSLLLVVLLYGENWKWQMYVAWNRLTIQFLAVLSPVLAAGFGAQSACRDAGAGDATEIRDGILYGK